MDRESLERALKQSANQWEATFDAISDAVCLIDGNGKIIRANKAMSRFLNKPFRDIIGNLLLCTGPWDFGAYRRMPDFQNAKIATKRNHAAADG